jgi:hypothetical protein
MELIWFIYEQYLNHPARNEDYVQTLGEFFSLLTQKFTSSISSSLVKNQQERYNSLFYDTHDDSDDMWTVHELNERQLLLFQYSSIEKSTTTDLPSIEQSKANDFLSIQQRTVCDFLASEQMLVVDQQPNSQPQVIISPVVPVNQHPDISTVQTKTKRKPRRSVEAQKRRNQKSSLRH